MPSATSNGDHPWGIPIDECTPIKVICIGAGMSGIQTGVAFPQKIKNLDLTIYEKNADVGDIPSHSYQYTYASNPDWSRFYASGKEMLGYLRAVAKRYDVLKYIQFGHQFKSAKWLEEQGKWEVTLLRLSDNQEIKDYADVFIKATGLLNSWDWPKIPGLHDFKGKLLHSADWDESYDVTGKRVAVIGYGSSALQIVPTIQPIVKSLHNFVRGPSWISPNGPGADEVKARGGTDNFEHSEEERREFREHPEKYHAFRHKIEAQLNRAQLVTFRGSDANKAFGEATDNSMRERLAKKPEIYKALRPDYPIVCKRISPGPRYLEALCQDNVEFIPRGVQSVTETGVFDDDGKFVEVDVIVCATGFDELTIGTRNLGSKDAVITGRGGVTLSEMWNPDPFAYYSMCPKNMPNFFLYLGPNGAPGAGSTIHMIEFTSEFMIKCVQKLQREHLKSMTVSDRALNAWQKQLDRYFAKTTFTYTCKSWAKRNQENGRVIALWPGSSVHARFALANPRWEDFEYESWAKDDDLAWLGSGLTLAQESGGFTTAYLDEVDMPPFLDAVKQ
ncbi:hypothetical protein SUNI508_12571 [Seiridium unicorne]|uniref:Uncharacterized protein n=1 Tax=Seiridium unicorne TaxID=138068 RepID=A0ABR2VGV1_9PEZI